MSMVSMQLLAKLTKSYKGEPEGLAEYLFQHLSDNERILQLVNGVYRKQRELEIEYQKNKAKLREELKEIQKQCKHLDTPTHHGAMAGESFTQCTICDYREDISTHSGYDG